MTYYCKLIRENDGFLVHFPDLPNVNTWGESKDHALRMAQEALNAVLETELDLELPSRQANRYSGVDYYPVEVEPRIAIALQVRALRGTSPQRELAHRMGVSYQAYQRLENPRKGNPTILTLQKVARLFNKQLEIHFK